ncbi:hypothetical protein HZR81_19105 [Pseudomonas sp. LM13]
MQKISLDWNAEGVGAMLGDAGDAPALPRLGFPEAPVLSKHHSPRPQMTAPMLISLQTAKAAGVQLKNLRSCQSRDGEAWSASVYFQGKKVGSVCDQGCGGPVDCDVPDSVLQTIRTAGHAEMKGKFTHFARNVLMPREFTK